ncbi:MAG: hypothetical protein U9R49_15495 [Bacteroidota bacterium]|nr:hypothetical protein [Bacteroidota bacterium]
MMMKIYGMAMKWNLFLLLPLVFVSFCLFSCAVSSVPELTHNEIDEKSGPSNVKGDAKVEEMPTSQGKTTVIGYPWKPQGLSVGGYALGEEYVLGYPMKSQNLFVGGNEQEINSMIGYPTKPKNLLAPTADEFMLLINR